MGRPLGSFRPRVEDADVGAETPVEKLGLGPPFEGVVSGSNKSFTPAMPAAPTPVVPGGVVNR